MAGHQIEHRPGAVERDGALWQVREVPARAAPQVDHRAGEGLREAVDDRSEAPGLVGAGWSAGLPLLGAPFVDLQRPQVRIGRQVRRAHRPVSFACMRRMAPSQRSRSVALARS